MIECSKFFSEAGDIQIADADTDLLDGNIRIQQQIAGFSHSNAGQILDIGRIVSGAEQPAQMGLIQSRGSRHAFGRKAAVRIMLMNVSGHLFIFLIRLFIVK